MALLWLPSLMKFHSNTKWRLSWSLWWKLYFWALGSMRWFWKATSNLDFSDFTMFVISNYIFTQRTAKSSPTDHLSISMTWSKIVWHYGPRNLANLVMNILFYLIRYRTWEILGHVSQYQRNSISHNSIVCPWHIWHLLVLATKLWSCVELLTYSLLSLLWKSCWQLWFSYFCHWCWHSDTNIIINKRKWQQQ